MGQELRRIISLRGMESGAVNAVGVWFYSVATDRYLYLMRDDAKHPGSWGLPGGKAEAGESLLVAMKRECEEEIGGFPDFVKLIPLEMFTSEDGKFRYHTFFCGVDQEFIPTLNHEHLGYAWIDSDNWPRPLHPGLWSTVNFDAVQSKIRSITQSMRDQTSQ